MTIETELTRDQFFQLSLLRHIQRPTFYVYALLSAVVTTYSIVQGTYAYILLGWIPFVMYLLLGLISSYRASRLKDAPYFLPTRYEFTSQGVAISTPQGESHLPWNDFEMWKQMVNCYVLVLTGGAILAIPQQSVPPHRVELFERLLQERIKTKK